MSGHRKITKRNRTSKNIGSSPDSHRDIEQKFSDFIVSMEDTVSDSLYSLDRILNIQCGLCHSVASQHQGEGSCNINHQGRQAYSSRQMNRSFSPNVHRGSHGWESNEVYDIANCNLRCRSRKSCTLEKSPSLESSCSYSTSSMSEDRTSRCSIDGELSQLRRITSFASSTTRSAIVSDVGEPAKMVQFSPDDGLLISQKHFLNRKVDEVHGTCGLKNEQTNNQASSRRRRRVVRFEHPPVTSLKE